MKEKGIPCCSLRHRHHGPLVYVDLKIEVEKDMTAEQWWKEHDLTFFRYCEKYKSVIDEAIGKANNFIDDKVWESGEYRWGDNWRY